MANILVAGGIAYDHILEFEGEFEDHFLPEKLHELSVSFQCEENKFDFGGCGANIAYSLSLLGENPIIVSSVGFDFQRYFDRFDSFGISRKYVSIDNNKPTAAAYVLSDQNSHQIAFFVRGAMGSPELAASLSDELSSKLDLAIISPDLPSRMFSLGIECKKKSIPYIFDPGQALPVFTKQDLSALVDGAEGLILNEYECDLLLNMLEFECIDEITCSDKFLVKTKGENGCDLYIPKQTCISIPAINVLDVKNVTGAGDCFRAGFIHGFVQGLPLDLCSKMGNTAASFSVSHNGPQDHSFSYREFCDLLDKNFS